MKFFTFDPNVGVNRNLQCSAVGDMVLRGMPFELRGREAYAQWDMSKRLLILSSDPVSHRQRSVRIEEDFKTLVPSVASEYGLHPCEAVPVSAVYGVDGNDFLVVLSWSELPGQKLSVDRSGGKQSRTSKNRTADDIQIIGGVVILITRVGK